MDYEYGFIVVSRKVCGIVTRVSFAVYGVYRGTLKMQFDHIKAQFPGWDCEYYKSTKHTISEWMDSCSL